MTRRKHLAWTGPALLLVSSLLVAGGATEIVLRVVFEDRYAQRPAFFQMDEVVGWNPAPNLHHRFHGGDYTLSIATDAQGRRLGTLGPVPGEAPIVLLAGDSYAFGWGVNTGETIASRLDERLAKRDGLRLVNLGVGGYGTLQSALRVQQAADSLGADRVRGLVMLHAHNDASDNVRFLLLRAGLLRQGSDRRVNFSGLHLVNLLSQAVEIVKAIADREAPGDEPGEGGAHQAAHRIEQDVLFSFHLHRVDRDPVEITLPGGFSVGSDRIEDWETRTGATLGHGALSGLQRAALTDAVSHMQCALRGRGIPVIHAVLHSAPGWYAGEVRRAVEASAACGNRPLYRGRVPVAGRFAGDALNAHSGGHFTPALNSHYAEVLGGWLSEAGLISAPR